MIAGKTFFCCLIVTVFLFSCVHALGQNQVSGPRQITGVVVEQNQNPLKGANVCAMGTRPMAGRIPCSLSSADGQFLINVYVADTYTIGAEHIEMGYPPFLLRIPGTYGKPDPIFPTVVVDDSTVPGPVKVVMGAKAGRLLLTILDGDSNKPIDSGAIKFCRNGDTERCYSISTAFPKGHFEVLTPEDQFTIKFETWRGPVPEYHGGVAVGASGGWVARSAVDDKGLPLETLQVDLGQRKEVTVRLK